MVTVEHFVNSENIKHFEAGHVIFEEGDPGDVMYAVQEGRVEISHNGQSLAVLGPGSIFGEMALIENSTRSATAMTVTDSKLVVIDKHQFLFLVHETPTFATRVMQILSERLHTTDDMLIN
jgi:CRP-like cAMP-binding protein